MPRRLRNFGRESAALSEHGFRCEELDLRDYFGDPAALAARLGDLDVLWVVGGNSFVLARAMAQAGFHSVATEAVAAERLVYAGYSAGACVAGPDLRGIHLMVEPDVLPDGYAPVAAGGLGWVPWRIIPHWRSDHPETAQAEFAVEHLRTEGLAFRTLCDGEAIVIDGGAA